MSSGTHISHLQDAAEFSGGTSVERAYLRALIEVLMLHPSGLRRWSVMRAIRTRCQRNGADISLKLEDEVERLFRRFCSEDSIAIERGNSESALFYRPSERAGEVWAVNRARASAWLAGIGEETARAN